jgi:hypothetical protein
MASFLHAMSSRNTDDIVAWAGCLPMCTESIQILIHSTWKEERSTEPYANGNTGTVLLVQSITVKHTRPARVLVTCPPSHTMGIYLPPSIKRSTRVHALAISTKNLKTIAELETTVLSVAVQLHWQRSNIKTAGVTDPVALAILMTMCEAGEAALPLAFELDQLASQQIEVRQLPTAVYDIIRRHMQALSAEAKTELCVRLNRLAERSVVLPLLYG